MWVPSDLEAKVHLVPAWVVPWVTLGKRKSTLVRTLPASHTAAPLWAFEQRILVQSLFTSSWTRGVRVTSVLAGKPPYTILLSGHHPTRCFLPLELRMQAIFSEVGADARGTGRNHPSRELGLPLGF